MNVKKSVLLCFIFYFFASFTSFIFASEDRISSPEEIIGFKVGEDFKLADWSRRLDKST